MKLEPGCYWISLDGTEWIVGEWRGDCWYVVGDDRPCGGNFTNHRPIVGPRIKKPEIEPGEKCMCCGAQAVHDWGHHYGFAKSCSDCRLGTDTAPEGLKVVCVTHRNENAR